MHIDELLNLMVEHKGSDLHIKAGVPPVIRINGQLVTAGNEPLSPDTTLALAGSMLSAAQRRNMEEGCYEMDLAYSIENLARFRVNIFKQCGTVEIAVRMVPIEVPALEALGLPPIVKDLTRHNRGLVLVTGPTGSGKSTTLAAMIEQINISRSCHIVTIEDPIEFLYKDKKSLVSQREIGLDTDSFASALKHVLRQDPDVILIGEMRDPETIATAITAAETGHLVLSTLHTADAAQTLDRIIDVFPSGQQMQIRLQLANNLQGIISQRLPARKDGSGRALATEILIASPTIRDMVLEKASARTIYGEMQKGSFHGMHTLNQSLVELCRQEIITYEEALSQADNPREFDLNMRGIFSGSGTQDVLRESRH
jgi:twitching motility protein PilT